MSNKLRPTYRPNNFHYSLGKPNNEVPTPVKQYVPADKKVEAVSVATIATIKLRRMGKEARQASKFLTLMWSQSQVRELTKEEAEKVLRVLV